MVLEQAIVGAVVGQPIKAAIELAVKHAQQPSAASKFADEVQTACELTVAVFGAVLFEMQDNCERTRLMALDETKVYFGVFAFDVSSALMPELCRLAPSPRLLHECQLVLSGLKRVDFFQRAAGLGSDQFAYAKARGFALDFIEKKHVERFNNLVGWAAELGKATYGEGWDSERLGLVPPRIDPAAPPNHANL